MGLSNSAARLTTRAMVIAPSHHRRLRVRNVSIDARMPQPDRVAAVGRLRVDSRRWRTAPTTNRSDRPNPDVRHPEIVATNRSFRGLLSARIAARLLALAD